MSTTYHFSGTVAWNRVGQFITTGGGLKTKTFTDPNTGLTPAGATQGGVAVTQITADPTTGQWVFTATDVLACLLDFGAGPQLVMANEAPNLILTASAATDSAVAALYGSASATRNATDARYRNGRRVSIWDGYGAVGDGSTDDTTAMQNAITAAGVGGSVYVGKGTFGQGRFKCGKITLLDFQTLEGDLSSVSNTAVPKNELYFSGLSGRTVTDGATTNTSTTITSATASFVAGDVGSLVQGTGIPNGTVIASVTNSTTAVLSAAATATGSSLSLTFSPVAITLGAGCTLSHVQLRGPGASTSTVGSYCGKPEATYDHAYWMSFGLGTVQADTFYSDFDRCGWRSCGTQVFLARCYNVNLIVPRMACQNETSTAWGIGIQADIVRALNIHGGSIEEYGAAGIKITLPQSQVNLFGVYNESAATGTVKFIVASGLSSFQLNAIGCMNYCDGLANWADISSSTARINSTGHTWNCSTGSSTTPTMYLMTTGSVRGIIGGGDDWVGVTKASVGFDGQTVGAAPGLTIQRPQGFGSGSSDIVMQGRAIAQAQKTVTTSYTVTGDDYTIFANGTSITVTLPDPLSATGALKGRRFVVKNINASSLTVNCSPGTRLIDGATSQTLTQNQSITVESDFSNGYQIVSKV